MRCVSKYSVPGMKFMPTPAAPLVQVKPCVETCPGNRHLAPGVGLHTVSDIFRVQQGLGLASLTIRAVAWPAISTVHWLWFCCLPGYRRC